MRRFAHLVVLPLALLAARPVCLLGQDETVQSLYERAASLQTAGELEPALSLYDRILALDSLHADSQWNRANILYALGRYEEALGGFRRVTELAPRFGSGYGNLGWTLILLGRAQEARAPTRRAMELDSTTFAWPLNLGHVHLLAGRPDSARAYYGIALRRMTSEEELTAALSDFDLFIDRGWAPEASRDARSWMQDAFDPAQVARAPRDTAATLFMAGQSAYQEGTAAGYERAARLFKEAAERYGETGSADERATALGFVAQTYRVAGPADSVLPYARAAQAIWEAGGDRGGIGLMDWAMADALVALGRTDEAIKAYRNAITRLRGSDYGANLPTIQYNLGRQLLAGGDAAGGLAAFEAALSPEDGTATGADRAEIQLWAGAALLALDRYDAAVSRFDSSYTLLEGRPADPADPLLAAAQRFAQEFGGSAMSEAVGAARYAVWAAGLYDAAGSEREAVQYWNLAGSSLFSTGRRADALPYLRAAQAGAVRLDDPGLLATTYGNLGRSFTYATETSGGAAARDSALFYWDLAARAADRAGNLDARATAFSSRGSLLETAGQLDSAAVYYQRAMELSRQTGDRQALADRLSDMASLHGALGRPDSAAHYYRRALALWDELARPASGALRTRRDTIDAVMRQAGIFDDRRAGVALSLARLEMEEGNSGEALELALDALEHFRARPSAVQLPAVGLLANLIGQVYADEGRPDSALIYYSRSLEVANQLGFVDAIPAVASNMAGALTDLGRPDSARTMYGVALGAARDLERPSQESTVLSNLSYFYHRQIGVPDLAKATAYYDSTTAMLAVLGSRTADDAARVSFLEQGFTETELFALAWAARAPEVGPRAAALGALVAAERGRAQALLDLLRDADADGERTAPEPVRPGGDLPARGDSLVRAVAARGLAALSYLATGDTLLTWLVLPSGGVVMQARPISTDSLATLAGRIRVAMGVGSTQMRSRLGTGDVDLTGDVESPDQTRGFGIDAGEAGDWTGAAVALADVLLPDGFADSVPAGLDVVILPQGPLTVLPFAVLPAGDGTLLGERNPVRYAPSLRSLLAVEGAAGADRAAAIRGALVVGNPSMPEGLQPLPAAGDEGRWVGDRLGADPLTGPAATERVVKERLPDAGVVHLATHGLAHSSEARALDSWIALAPVGTPGDPGYQDGLLSVREILEDVDGMRAELVVLSACQTGLGNLRQAEGTVGLQRAFLARGARSVLVSLWSVSDRATSLLMQRFYEHWLDDADSPGKAEALRRAQEDLRTRPGGEFADPVYWAAFQLVGAN